MSISGSLPIPENEKERLESLLRYKILDTTKDEDLEQLTQLTAAIFQVPIVLITIIDEKRQWFKSHYGLNLEETERSIAFCQYTIMGNNVFEVENALEDNRFTRNPLVLHDPHIRFYGGAPLINEQGFKMGSLAVIDRKPRKLDQEQKKILSLLARQVVNFFELNLKRRELEKEKHKLEQRVQERTSEIAQKLAELENRDKKLISLNNELGRFIYKLTHDMLGPLKTMQGVINLSMEEVQDEKAISYLEMLRKTQEKLDNTLVSLIKMVAVKDASEATVIKWKDIVYTALANSKKRSGKTDIKLDLNIKSEHKLSSDPSLMELLLEELMVNSAQYNLSKSPEIEVNISNGNGNILLQIRDNGIGIREQEGEKIFEMFYKNEKSGGSGLGLYIVKNIVEKLQGKISYESTRNQGTVFKIQFPVSIA